MPSANHGRDSPIADATATLSVLWGNKLSITSLERLDPATLLEDMKRQEQALDDGIYPVDNRDRKTPDDWVPRHEAMVRLTGRHPFNAEPPLCLLNQDLTTSDLHYVRNHGAVPRLAVSSHRVEVSGLVGCPGSFSISSLLQIGALVTIPVTLVCAGNRRKELNQIRQSIGFHWGAGGASTSLWTGIRLADLLRYCQVQQTPKARFVCFTGADNPAKGPYGTSIPLAMAMDPHADVLLAVAQNGKPLHPDHGYPVRLLVPGWIGGRMVKWLTRIEVSEFESQNHYHFFDNRIMPPHVDKERADAEKWWYRPEYLFNELNINAAVVRPLHDELFPLHQATDQRSYRIEGYAYSGGGRPITRVEITFDDGQHWHLCETRHPFEPNAAGRQWAWARFTYDASLVHLLCCTEFAVRAWDCSNNTQPHRWTWNVMGMGNNAWFRVRVLPVPDPNTGGISLRFEHPTVPGPSAGGWMPPPSTVSSEQQGAATSVAPTATATVITQNGAEEAGRVPAVPKLVANPAVSPPPPSVVGSTVHGSNVYQQMMRKKAAEKMQHTEQRLFTLTQVEQHQTEADTWIIVRGRVYDVTAYLNDHPGGKAAIMMNAGQDCTEDFEAIHSEKAWKLLEDFCIGKVVPAETALADTPHLAYTDSSTDLLRQQLAKDANPLKAFVASTRDEKKAGSEQALDPKRWCSFSLLSREYITADTLRLRFALPDPEQSLGLPTGNHLLIRAQMNDKIVIRAYTPTSLGHTLGYFELVIKVYRAGIHPKFPDGGKMSQYLDGLCIGDSVEVKGPLGHFTYLGNGSYLLHGRPGRARQFVFLCAGTGITPAFQVMKAILNQVEEHKSQPMQPDIDALYLIYANRTKADILLYDELESWRQNNPQLHICYVLSQASGDSLGASADLVAGHVTRELLRARLPGPSPEVMVGICGPPGFQDEACIPALQALGFTPDLYFTF